MPKQDKNINEQVLKAAEDVDYYRKLYFQEMDKRTAQMDKFKFIMESMLDHGQPESKLLAAILKGIL